MLLANLFSLVGFISVYLNKISMSKSHFTSYHGQIGLAVVFHMIFQLFMGIMLQFYSKFKALIFVPYLFGLL
ncbi:hypothetical protein D917_09017 [Trichinella nativa]|uniref:Cytochrome b561 domain-containing protein n=1 Tax=Trichinella nativa TaxID=6335 RepID=A0A1Y3EHC8_9BILA|nr:hypothetical protein D917_09017 [Trichinella nativa]